MSLELFETEPPVRLLARFAWPSILMLLANGLYNVVDRAFVGQLVGTQALTAVTVVFPLSIAILALGLGVGQGVASQVSLSLGAKNLDEAEGALGLGVTLALGTSGVLALVLGPFTEPLLRLMGTPEAVVLPARNFFWVTLAGMPFLTVSMGVGMAIRSQGRAKSALVTGLVGITANVVFCWLFIGVWGWGLQGSAWASVAAQFLGALVTVGWYFTPLTRLRLRIATLWPGTALTRRVAQLGVPTMTGNLVGMVLMIIFNVQVQGYGGTNGLALVGVINTLANLFFLPAYGLVNGAVPLFGYYQGAEKAFENRHLFQRVLTVMTVFFVLCTALVELWPEALLGIFSHDPALLAFGLQPLRVFLALMALGALQVLPGAYFQAIGKPASSTVLSLCRPVTLGVLVLILPAFWGFNGFLASGPLSDAVGIAVAVGSLAADRSLRSVRPSVDSKLESVP
ncbi:MAG TPA: MATE family efflux transporter [Spirochaetia bacterium]|nr:MATE family efflux transporter [Spirochaetia bacterium]